MQPHGKSKHTHLFREGREIEGKVNKYKRVRFKGQENVKVE
jgi:hypothetical protein